MKEGSLGGQDIVAEHAEVVRKELKPKVEAQEEKSESSAEAILNSLDACQADINNNPSWIGSEDNLSHLFREVNDMIVSQENSDYPQSEEIKARFREVVSAIHERISSRISQSEGGNVGDEEFSRLERGLINMQGMSGFEDVDAMLERIGKLRVEHILKSIGVEPREPVAQGPVVPEQPAPTPEAEPGITWSEFSKNMNNARTFDDLISVVKASTINGVVPSFRSGDWPSDRMIRQIEEIRDEVPEWRGWLGVGDFQSKLKELAAAREEARGGIEGQKNEILPEGGSDNPEADPIDAITENKIDDTELPAEDFVPAVPDARGDEVSRVELFKQEKDKSSERMGETLREIEGRIDGFRHGLEEFKTSKYGNKGPQLTAEFFDDLREYAGKSEQKALVVNEWLKRRKSAMELDDYWLKTYLYNALDQKLAEMELERSSNLPELGKVIAAFRGYYNEAKIEENMGNKSSDYLAKLSRRGRMMVIYSDLLNISLKSDNPEMREYLLSMKNYKDKYPASADQVDESATKDKDFVGYVEALESLYESSSLSKGILLSKDSDMDMKERYSRICGLLKVGPSVHPVDRLAEMYLRPAGMDSVEGALEAMDRSTEESLKRRMDYADEISEKGEISLEEGDLIKGIDMDFFENTINGGIKSSEYHGDGRSRLYTDKTPFGADFSRASEKDGIVGLPFSEAIKNSAAFTYGDVYLVCKNRGQYFFSDLSKRGADSEYGRENLDQYETYQMGHNGVDNAEDHFDVRTGLPSGEIDAIVIKKSDNQQKVIDILLESGRYIPVTDHDGKLVLTPEMFDEMKRKKSAE